MRQLFRISSPLSGTQIRSIHHHILLVASSLTIDHCHPTRPYRLSSSRQALDSSFCPSRSLPSSPHKLLPPDLGASHKQPATAAAARSQRHKVTGGHDDRRPRKRPVLGLSRRCDDWTCAVANNSTFLQHFDTVPRFVCTPRQPLSSLLILSYGRI